VIPPEKLAELGAPDGLTALAQTAFKAFAGNRELPGILAGLRQLHAGRPPGQAALVKVLFLAANPLETPRLRIGREFRAIEECLQHPGLPVKVELKSFWAAEPGKLLESILRQKPDVVHFSGHCEDPDGIALEGPDGESVLVGAEPLGQLFVQLNQPPVPRPVRCVVLNACRSEPVARGLSRSVDVVTGTDAEVGDDAAIAFAQGFYLGLADGRSVGNAAGLGKAQMDLVARGDGMSLRDLLGEAGDPDPESSERIVVVSRKGVKPDQLFLGQPGR
jgi:hypothetical protein